MGISVPWFYHETRSLKKTTDFIRVSNDVVMESEPPREVWNYHWDVSDVLLSFG